VRAATGGDSARDCVTTNLRRMILHNLAQT
jgi:hypothetical protein